TGADVDLYALPLIVHHEGDAGPYITSAISFARDPTSETWNCAYNRLMIQGRDTTSIHLTLGKHLREFQRIAELRGEVLPLALVIGVHPQVLDRKSTRLNSSHVSISYAVFCLKKKKQT